MTSKLLVVTKNMIASRAPPAPDHPPGGFPKMYLATGNSALSGWEPWSTPPFNQCLWINDYFLKHLSLSLGLVISLLLAISWVGSAQFSQIANTGNQEKFNSPYFTTWFSTLWMIFCYPGYLLFSVFKPRRYQIKTAEIFRLEEK